MMAAESPLSLSPSQAREDLESLNLDDDEDEQTSSSSLFAPRLISATRSELNGGDPLLNPPFSPSPPSSPGPSTGSFSSPSSSPIFKPQKIQNGGSERLGLEFTRISVTDPLKEIDPNPSLGGSSTYVNYLITAKSVNDGREFRVRRRFRDVVTLADRLAESYRGYFIPARPDKSVVEGQVMHRHEFVEQRRTSLEKYLRRLAAHPIVGRSEELRTFLRAPASASSHSQTDNEADSEDGLPVPSRPQVVRDGLVGSVSVKGGRDFFGMFSNIKQTVVNGWGGGGSVAGSRVLEEDKEFLVKKAKVLDLAQQLTTISQQAEALVKAQQDMGETMGEMGMTFIKLSKFETEQSKWESQTLRADVTRQFALTAVKVSRLQRALNSQTVTHLDTLHEYLGLMIPINNAFSDRAHALNTVQTLSGDILSLHARLDKIEAASVKVFGQDRMKTSKIEELRETIRFTADTKNNAIRQYERIKENNKSEMQRIEKERRSDFMAMLKGFVNSQVGYSQRMAVEWEKLADETKQYVRPGH
ncbi:sorting nexin 2B-like [Carex rostrata]